jgi:hypothetical protein
LWMRLCDESGVVACVLNTIPAGSDDDIDADRWSGH